MNKINIKEIIEIGCIKNNISVTELAQKLGTSKQNLFNKLYRNDLRFSDLQKICDVLGIEIKFIKDNKEI